MKITTTREGELKLEESMKFIQSKEILSKEDVQLAYYAGQLYALMGDFGLTHNLNYRVYDFWEFVVGGNKENKIAQQFIERIQDSGTYLD